MTRLSISIATSSTRALTKESSVVQQVVLDPSWLLRKDRLDRRTRLQQILEIFPFQGAVYGRHTKIHKNLMWLRSVQIHPSRHIPPTPSLKNS